MRLSASFFDRDDVVQIAQDLLGKHICTQLEGELSVGRIVETEAYRAPEDRASHAYNNRLTLRTRTMFGPPGHAYIYLCYGIHHMFNFVTGPEGTAHAVLLRGIEPVEGITHMLKRRNLIRLEPKLSAGPGIACKALGLSTQYDGTSLLEPQSVVWVEDRDGIVSPKDIVQGTRVGVAYAGEDAFLPWRFSIRGNPYVSPGKGLTR
jgi:DNA-3-methyladenine glycosylase